MEGKNAKMARWAPIIPLLFVGLIFAVVGAVFCIQYQDFKQNGTKTTAIITNILEDYSDDETSYDVYVQYYHNGEEFNFVNLGYHSSSMDVGDTVEIYISANDPTDIIAVKSNVLFLVFLSVGGVLMITALIIFVVQQRRIKHQQYLKDLGRKIYATVTSIDTNTQIAINNVHPVKIVLTDENGTTYKSQNLFDFNNKLAIGDKVAVFVDAMDQTEYFVDITDTQTEQSPILF